MTDIIELTQRMREAAENATRGEWIKENGDGWEAICCDDDQANGNFIIAKFLGPDKARNREFVQAVQPQNIRTLCDAIAQRDAQNSELRAQKAALKADFIRLDRQMSVLEQTGITDRDRADKAEAQIAELAKQEPVYQFIMNRPDIDGYIEWVDCNKDYFDSCGDDMRRIVYAAPPAPFVVPDEVVVFLNHLEDVLPYEAFNMIDVKIWNSVSMLSRTEVFRAAMLNRAADGSVAE